jgi:pyruvate kinase
MLHASKFIASGMICSKGLKKTIMSESYIAPRVPLRKFKKTKIVATIGPVTNSYEAIKSLIAAGANAIRLNFSHGNHEERIDQIKWIRQASLELGKPVAIIQDLQGPKIRMGDFEGEYTAKKDVIMTLSLSRTDLPNNVLPVQFDLSQKVKPGERVYIFDGKIKTIALESVDGELKVRIENDGIILKRKGINLPDTDFGGDTITEKDIADLAFGATQDIDYVAQSFIQSAKDIVAMKQRMADLGMNAKHISKVETKAAIENLVSIVEATDVLMVARGDLAVEVNPESVPIIQRDMILLGMQYAKPVIVATQMLFSMTENPEPTRAEVSDVGTAVILGADAVMLSDETANGKYPLLAVETMKKIILACQDHEFARPLVSMLSTNSPTLAISAAVTTLATQVKAVAIVAETKSGATARYIAARRPMQPLIIVTSDARTAQQSAIYYGSKSYVRPDDAQAAQKLSEWLKENSVLTSGDIIVSTSGQYPGRIGATDTIKVRVLE